MSAVDIVCLGEPLYEFSALPGKERPGRQREWLQGFGGDTSNCAIAAARQGASAAYVTRLGKDEFGEQFLKLLLRVDGEVRGAERRFGRVVAQALAQGFVALLGGDEALLHHAVEDEPPASFDGCLHFGVGTERVEVGGSLRQRGKQRRFAEREFADRLAEEGLRGSFRAVSEIAVVDFVEVQLQHRSGDWRWRPLRVVLRWLREGTQSDEAFGWGAPGSPLHLVLTGYIAREVGDVELARGQLSLAAAYYRGQLEERGNLRSDDPEWRAWVELLAVDAARV